MTIFTCEPKSLMNCKPGDLIRLPHKMSSTFAIVTRGSNDPRSDGVGGFVAISDAEPGLVYPASDDNPMALCFGRNYRIDARHDRADMIADGGNFTQGCIVCCVPHNGALPATYLMCLDGLGNDKWLDIETGVLRGQPGGSKIDVSAWEMTLLDGRTPARVIHRQNWP